MDVREIKKLITLMNENDLHRLEVEEEGKRYLLQKGPSEYALGYLHQLAAQAPLPPAAALSMGGPATPGAPSHGPSRPEGTVTFNSPMVGTFYRSSSPEAEAFVKQGDHVGPDSVVCIIEAMKVFNEVKAEMSGTIVEVLAENAEAVEYNQPLFLIRPD
jgi:acetyl-CoA carboxylase biotin carboxyl carrier protein